MPSFISPLTRDEERERERERERATAVAVAARAKTFFYLTLPPPTNDDDAPIFVLMQVLSLNYSFIAIIAHRPYSMYTFTRSCAHTGRGRRMM